MLSERSKLSLCQFLDLQTWSNLGVLLRKYGLEVTGHDISDLVPTILVASSDQLRSLLSEVVTTKRALRSQIEPKYRFDQRWCDLVRCLLLDGYKVGNHELVAVDPTIEGAEPLDDDLTTSLSECSLPQADEVIRLLDSSTIAFRKVPPEINACLTEARVALETIATSIADDRQRSDPGVYDNSKWGEVISYLRKSSFLTVQEEKGLAGVYGFISSGAHAPLGPEDLEMARLGRSLAIGMIYFLIKRYGQCATAL